MYLDLSGEWQISLEAEEGRQEGLIRLPGTLQAAGYGNPVTRQTPWVSSLHDPFWYEQEEYRYAQEDGVNVPFLCQPPRHFLGQAVYERKFRIPEERRGQRICGNGDAIPEGQCASGEVWHFHIEAARWHSQVWIDGEKRGEDCTLCGPHDIPVGNLAAGEHTLRVVLDNSMIYPYRPDAHGVSDALGGTWNGMVGEIALFTQDEFCRRQLERARYAKMHPRKIEAREGNFYLDGEPFYFRGTHFGGEYPLTGYPETGKAWWAGMMKTIREWGLNGIRFHSYCPPEAAFAAADEEGICLLVECGMWNHFDKEMTAVLRRETRRILEYFGHHPSFVFFSPSNEPGGAWYKPLREWVKETAAYDRELGYGGRRLYTAQSGWFYDVPPSEIEGTDFIYFHRSGYGPYMGGTIRNPRGWRGGDYSPSLEGVKKPVICHELGQICAYPDYSVAEKFTGYLQPGNYKVFRENARANGILPYLEDFVHCSGENQLRLYKEELEANFRTPEIQGFELLDLHDYLGQGTALVGILDAFWESKGYGKPEEFRNYCADTVILARCSSYVWKNTDRAVIPVEVCHYGKEDIEDGLIRWKLLHCGKIAGEGTLSAGKIEKGGNTKAGSITLDFHGIGKNCELTLELELEAGGSSTEQRRELEAGGSSTEWQGEPEADGSPMERRKEPEADGTFAELQSVGKRGAPAEPKNSTEQRDYAKPGNAEGQEKTEETGNAGNRCIARNSWKLYVFTADAGQDPALCADDYISAADSARQEPLCSGSAVLYTRDWNQAKSALEAGGRVVYAPWLSDLNYECTALSGRSVSWNGQMGPSWCRTMGIVAEEKHPVFRYFPTEKSGGWQWEDILKNARGFHMEGLEQVKPIVQPIDDWNRNLLQGLLLEGKVLNGKLLLISADLEGGFEERPAAYALKRALLQYAASREFDPEVQISPEAIEDKLFPMLRMEKLAHEIFYDCGDHAPENDIDNRGKQDLRIQNEKARKKDMRIQNEKARKQDLRIWNGKARKQDLRIWNGKAIVEGDPNTSVRVESSSFPIQITISFIREISMDGILYVPEQRDRDHAGFAREYELEVRDSGTGRWRKAAKGVFRNTCRSQRVLFPEKMTGDAVRLTVFSAYGCVDRYVWQESGDGWHRVFRPGAAVLQIAGIHAICGEEGPHEDVYTFGSSGKTRTREIEF